MEMETSTKVIIKKEEHAVKVFLWILKAQCTRVSGLMICIMVRVLKPGMTMPSAIKVILQKAKRPDMDVLNLMEITMKVNSEMGHSMVKEHTISMILGKSIQVNLQKIIFKEKAK